MQATNNKKVKNDSKENVTENIQKIGKNAATIEVIKDKKSFLVILIKHI
jgi:hypothetical protein